jgi:hypothetical protein
MYKILTSTKENEHIIDTALLHNEQDYLLYIKDKCLIKTENKDILFGKPICYPAILVTHFRASFTKFINHKVYGEYIYIDSFDEVLN